MCFFKKLREKKAKEKEQRRIEAEIRAQQKKDEEEEKNKPVEKEEIKEKEVKESQVKENEPVKEEKAEETKEQEAKPEKNTRYSGKYEVYPEAGMFKFRLRASNGEILLVSNGYKNRDGAKNGINTLKKNLENGTRKIIRDKNDYYQFRISTPNDGRLIITSEIYPSSTSCQSALNSTLKFGESTKIIDLDEIPDSEIREWVISVPGKPRANGKIELFLDEEKKWRGRLLASNSEVLFVTPSFVSRSGLENGLKAIKTRVAADTFHVVRDKQNRFQFQLTNDSGQILLMGETYSDRSRAISAADSVRGFLPDAVIVDTVALEREKQKAEKAAAKKETKKPEDNK